MAGAAGSSSNGLSRNPGSAHTRISSAPDYPPHAPAPTVPSTLDFPPSPAPPLSLTPSPAPNPMPNLTLALAP